MSQSRSHSKSSTGSGSGHRPRYYGFWTAQARAHRSVAVVDQSLRYASARRAKLGFWITFVIVSTYTDVVVRSVHGTGPIRAFLIGTLAGLAAGSIVFVLAFCWPAVRLTVHWAAELLALSALLGAYLLLTTAVTAPVAAGVLLLAVCGPLTYPPARRRLLAYGWCVITRHRLRVCFAEFIRARQTDGRLPLILAARPTPAGERIWVWLRAGLALGDLEGRFDEIAVATWATDVTQSAPSGGPPSSRSTSPAATPSPGSSAPGSGTRRHCGSPRSERWWRTTGGHSERSRRTGGSSTVTCCPH
jgi:hypothetical protein